MEMSSQCAHAVEATRPVRGPHGGWKKQEIDALQSAIRQAEQDGESLRSVFERVAAQLGRKPNSIRNFYYAQVRSNEKAQGNRTLPFETFKPDEVEQLVKSVLTARAKGMSVRACVRSLAGGDRTKMLRYQNKYRSTIRTRPELVSKVMQRLTQEGVAFVSPYAAEGETDSSLSTLRRKAEQADDPQLSALLTSLEHLFDLALNRRESPASITEENDALRRADRLGAHCDMLRIALEDEQTRRNHLQSEAQEMVALIKEYIALPEADRTTHCNAFCRQAAVRLSAVECALMDDARDL